MRSEGVGECTKNDRFWYTLTLELMSTENLTLTFAALAVVVTVIYGDTDSAYHHHHPHQGCAVGPTVNSLTFVSTG